MKPRTLKRYDTALLDQVKAEYRALKSIPQIADATNRPNSTIRKLLIAMDEPMRSRADGVRLRGDVLGKHLLGTRRSFSAEHKQKISAGKIRHGDNHARGVRVNPRGYMEYTRGQHCGRAVHQVVMEVQIERRMLPGECVHHKDQNKLNNAIENLQLMTRSEHAKLHRKMRKENNV